MEGTIKEVLMQEPEVEKDEQLIGLVMPEDEANIIDMRQMMMSYMIIELRVI